LLCELLLRYKLRAMRVQLKAICMPQFSPFSHFNLQRNLMLYILDLQLALQQVHSLVSCRNGSSRGYISIREVNSCATKGSLGRLQFPPSGHRMGWDAEAVRNMHDAQQTRCGPGRRRGSTSYVWLSERIRSRSAQTCSTHRRRSIYKGIESGVEIAKKTDGTMESLFYCLWGI